MGLAVHLNDEFTRIAKHEMGYSKSRRRPEFRESDWADHIYRNDRGGYYVTLPHSCLHEAVRLPLSEAAKMVGNEVVPYFLRPYVREVSYRRNVPGRYPSGRYEYRDPETGQEARILADAGLKYVRDTMQHEYVTEVTVTGPSLRCVAMAYEAFREQALKPVRSWDAASSQTAVTAASTTGTTEGSGEHRLSQEPASPEKSAA